MVITTVYYGASAETVRGFLTTPIERVVSAISGVDYLESTSRAGVSTVTVRLKLDHSSTSALAEVTRGSNRYDPSCRQRPSRRSLKSNAPTARTHHSIPLYFHAAQRAGGHRLAGAHAAAPIRDVAGVQRVGVEGGRQIAMRVWIHPDRLAALNLSPGDVRRLCGATTSWRPSVQREANLVQINLLAQH